jgi:hypothetical protein
MFGFKLKNVLSASSTANGDDVLGMKQALNHLGEYDPPAYGMTPYPDTPMFDGMKAFQKKNGLTVDGFARPGGPTETKLNSRLVNGLNDSSMKRVADFVSDPKKSSRPMNWFQPAYIPGTGKEVTRPTVHFFKKAIQKADRVEPALRLGRAVGLGQVNRPQDVIGLKNALAWVGHYPVDKAHQQDATPDEDLHWGLMGFQQDYGLKTDGFSRPGGETEARLNDLISPLIKRASTTTSESHPDEPTTGANLPTQTGMSTDARTEDAKSGSVQVADASGYRPSGWQNPTKWALEEAGQQTQGAAEELVGDVKHAANEGGDRVRGGALDAAEGALRIGADAGRAAGLDNAADNLDHFLDGTGKDRTYSRDKARERPFIREAEHKNQERFVDGLLVDEKRRTTSNSDAQFNYRSDLLGMKDGDTIHLTPDGFANHQGSMENWDTIRGTAGHAVRGEIDEALAFGTSKFRSNDDNGFMATRDGDTIIVTGTVTHKWGDRYDFHGEESPYPVMNGLRDDGRAAEYDSSASWRQEMTATLKIKNGELQIDSVNWRDID